MTRWRPTPAEERWLAVASRLRVPADAGEFAARTGGWRVTGPLARIALFVFGLLAAGLVWALVDLQAGLGMLVAGIAVLGAGEWLVRARRLHASGVEEALVLAGIVMIGAWAIDLAGAEAWAPPMLAAAFLLAGLRLLNPLLTTVAAFVFVAWLQREAVGRSVDASLGYGTYVVLLSCLVAGGALVAGARELRRPSHDRMLDWLVAALPLAAYAYGGGWSVALPPEIRGAMSHGGSRALVPALLGAFAVAALVVGIRRRAHAPLLAFLGGTACVLLEVYRYTGLSAEAWLIVCGAGALVAGIALDRYLRRPRRGVTSERLTDRDGPLDLLQLAGATVLAQRGVAGATADPDARVTAGGGRFGGGGAGGSY